MTIYINGVLQPQPIQWVAWVGYADTAGRFVIVSHNGMVLHAGADALEREEAHDEELRQMQDRLQRLIDGAVAKDAEIARLTAEVKLKGKDTP